MDFDEFAETDTTECHACGAVSLSDEWVSPDWPTDIPDFDPADFIQCPVCLQSRRIG